VEQQALEPQAVYPVSQTQAPLELQRRLDPEQLPEQQRPPTQTPETHSLPPLQSAPLASLSEQVPVPAELLQY
jgi:hypothetical protein